MFLKRYREVIPSQASQERVKEIVLNTGGSQSTLQDIKVSEHANGYCYKYFEGKSDRNRFIYWRTYSDILELSEISLDVTLTDNHIRYRFTDSPVLSVHITERVDCVVILVATVNSLHRLYFKHPDKLPGNDSNNPYRSYSIFRDATAQDAKDPATFFTLGQHSSANSQIAHNAACWLAEDTDQAYYALAHGNSLTLYTMDCDGGQTVAVELRQSQIVPRILTNFAGALRGKNASDGSYVNSIMFKVVDGQLYLYALYRDDQVRMWSAKKGNCVASVNILPDYGEQRIQGSQCDALCSGPNNSICVFLNFFSGGCEFKTFEAFSEPNGNFTLSLSSTIPAPQCDLVDYQLVGNRIWALWCNSEGEFDVSSICLTTGSINWVSVALELPPDQSDINVNSHPREGYCSYIFSPGRFQAATIAKALVMFRRSNVPVDADLPLYKLKERVCQAIECEMQNEIKDLDLTDEEYMDINLQLWERFYSCCEQYHLKAAQPIGLVSLEALGGMCIVKKNLFSLIRPCELLEHVMLYSAQQSQHPSTMIAPEFGFQDRQTDQNLMKLIGVLGKIDAVLPNATKHEISNKLLELEMPSNIISTIVRQFLSLEVEEQPFTKDFIAEVRQKLLQISDVPRTMWQLLECLQMNKRRDSAEDDDDDGQMDTYEEVGELQRNLFQLGNLFCSGHGKSFVAESLQQIVLVRYALCRNLLILQHLLSETFSLSNEVLRKIQSNCQGETAIFLQAYFVLKWVCESPISVQQIAANQKNDSMHQVLQSLQLYETFPRQSFSCGVSQQCTLVEYFLHGKGSILSLTQLAKEGVKNGGGGSWELLRDTADWECTLTEVVRRVGQLLWPMTDDFVFGEWLIGSGQGIMIEEYVRLLNGWCQWNRSSRDFIRAVTMLNNGELYKAYDYFMAATAGVCSERFLLEKVLQSSRQQVEELGQGVVAQYYMRVLQLFEQKPALDCVIRMARAAIEILSEVAATAEANLPRKAMFQSIVFMNQLKLEHYEEAYDSLVNNVEEQRRREGLRQLVVCLFQKKRLDLLMHFPYVGLQSEFEHIVEQRARSMGMEENVHYKFLYAHHVTKENFRRAAFCMYEQAMRLQLECDSAAATEMRYSSLLACINALHLVDSKYQFIAKPVVTREHVSPTDKLQVEVLQLADVKRELVHTEAILALHRFHGQRQQHGSTGIMRLDAQELLGVLSSAHLYTLALRLADAFGLSKVPVVKSLTATCVELCEEVDERAEAWEWLQENSMCDLPVSNSPVELAWSLLQRVIAENEKEHEVQLKRAAVEAILSSTTAFVPRWLHDSMRRANANLLLQLFVKYGRLVEGAEYAVELVWAMLGRGYEYFGLNNPLLANGGAMCFPANAMDLLLYNLRVNVEENGARLPPGDLELLKESLKNVQDVCGYYKEKVLEVSLNKSKYEREIANRMEA